MKALLSLDPQSKCYPAPVDSNAEDGIGSSEVDLSYNPFWIEDPGYFATRLLECIASYLLYERLTKTLMLNVSLLLLIISTENVYSMRRWHCSLTVHSN